MRININMNLEKDFIRGLLYEYKTHSQIDSIEKIDDKDILNIMKSEDMRNRNLFIKIFDIKFHKEEI